MQLHLCNSATAPKYLVPTVPAEHGVPQEPFQPVDPRGCYASSHRLQGTGGCEARAGRGQIRNWSSGPSEPPTSEPTGPFSNASDGLNCVMDQNLLHHSTIPHMRCGSPAPRAGHHDRISTHLGRDIFSLQLPDQSDTHGLRTAHKECAVDSRQILLTSIRLAVTRPGRTIRFKSLDLSNTTLGPFPSLPCYIVLRRTLAPGYS